jgi:Tol biopolymer transport system component
MAKRQHVSELTSTAAKARIFLTLIFAASAGYAISTTARSQAAQKPSKSPSPQTELNPKQIPFRIVYETCHRTEGRLNWELYIADADGSNQLNLTRTPEVHEMYPIVSPDAGKICFVADELVNGSKVRSVYYMTVGGTDRIKVAENARQPCWSPDSKTIAYTKGEFDRYTTTDYATKGLYFYDLQTGQHKEHPNKDLLHLYNICWTPDGKWFIATVHGAMGYKHTNLAIQADGKKFFDLDIEGCRPDVTLDGTKIVWCPDERALWVGDLDLTASGPQVTNRRIVFARSGLGTFQQQADWSPDGKFIAFGRGPKKGGAGHYPVAVGNPAKGWDICVGNLDGKWVRVTTDGSHNKEPDWVPVPPLRR